MSNKPKREKVHTPEPWSHYTPAEQADIRKDAKLYAPKGYIWRIGANPMIGLLFRAHPNDPDPREADARRIVHCVNACEGINPAAVPKLLAACKHLAAVAIGIKDIGNGEPGWFMDEATRQIISAAIAEAETKNG